MPIDFQWDSDFNLLRSDSGEYQFTDGRQEFHQTIARRLTGNIIDEDSGSSGQNMKNRLRRAINRTAREYGLLDQIQDISIEQDRSNGSWDVSIVYTTGETFSRDLQ